jgi:hypothetical protein
MNTITDDGHQAMWPQMIAALAAIDEALGLPADGCNSTAQTLEAIRGMRARIAELEAHKPAQVAAPDEWKWVPVQPTLEMRQEGGMWDDSPECVYARMLAAAPKREGGAT